MPIRVPKYKKRSLLAAASVLSLSQAANPGGYELVSLSLS